jgi:hypothetical protein
MNKVLLAGLICISLGAFAQSSADQGQTPNAKTASTKTAAAPQDASSQTAGKRMHKPVAMQQEAGASGQTAGKGGKTASDDWTNAAKTNGSKNGQPTRVATGDVNGDGRPDLTATKSSGSATTGGATTKTAAPAASSSAPSPRDAASGQASGKRQHEPVTVHKEVDAATPKLK